MSLHLDINDEEPGVPWIRDRDSGEWLMRLPEGSLALMSRLLADAIKAERELHITTWTRIAAANSELNGFRAVYSARKAELVEMMKMRRHLTGDDWVKFDVTYREVENDYRKAKADVEKAEAIIKSLTRT